MRTGTAPPSRLVAFVLLTTGVFGTASFAQQISVRPELSFSSYLLSPTDKINAMKVGSDGSIYVAGVTLTHASRLDPTVESAGEGKAFVAKLSPDGTKLVYFTSLSSSTADEARALALDSVGNTYVAGVTSATDFTVIKPLQSSCKLDGAGQCAGTAFVAKLNAAGAVVFATYLGGSVHDEANAIAVDKNGNMFIAGSTQSLDFPVESAVQQTTAGRGDAFVSAIAADGSRLLFSTYLGGSDSDEALALALDASGSVYVTGKTTSQDFPTEGVLQTQCRANARGECSGSAFVTKLSADGKTINYSSYLGGSGGDAGSAIVVDASGKAYVAGVTSSPDFPTANAAQAALNGQRNAFVSTISQDGSALFFSTYLGGSGADQANGIALDKSGNVVVAGATDSNDFPTQNALQSSCNRDKNGACTLDAFVAALTPDGSRLRFSTYLGGTGTDASRALAIDAQGSAYLGGWTTSRDFSQAKWPVVPPNIASAHLSSRNPGGAFVAKITGLSGIRQQPGSCSNNWIGTTAGDSQWGTPTNWSSGQVPVASDNVCIASTFKNTITIGILGSSNQTISSLTSGAPIAFTSGPLTISGASAFSGTLALSAGTLAFDGSTTIATFNVAGGAMAGTGPVTVTGKMNWTAGAVGGTGGLTIGSGATLTIIQANFTQITLSTTLKNQGTVVQSASGGANNFVVASPGVIDNSGHWTVSSNFNPNISASGVVVFNNAGSFVQSTGTGTSTWTVPINGSGTINVASGTLVLKGASTGSITGSIAVQASAVLDYNQGGTLDGGQVTGSGTFIFTATTTVNGVYGFSGTTEISGGTVSFNGKTTIATFNVAGGAMAGTGPVTVTGKMNWTAGAVGGTGGLTIGSGATLTIIQANFTQITLSTTLKNQGTVVQSASGGANNFVVASPGVIDNSGHWTVSSNFNPNISASGVVVFNNAGSFVQSTGTGTSTWTVPINGSGTINVASGTLVLKGASTGSITGSIAVQASAVLDYNQGGTLDGGQVTGSGTFIFTATTTVNGVYGFSGTTEISGGTVSFNGKTTIATFNVAGGAMAGTGPVTVTGKMNWTAGAVGGTGGLTIGSGATLTIIQANFTQITLSTTLKNQGTVVQSASGGANNFVVASPGVIDNSGHWTVSSNFNPNISASGVVVFNNAGSFVQSTGTGTSTWTVPINGSGTINVASGTLVLKGASTGSITGSIAVQASAVLDYNQGGTLDGGQVTGSGTFIFTATTTVNGVYGFSGTTEISGGTVSFNGKTTIATFNVAGGAMAGTGPVTVTGKMNWTAGAVGGTGGLTIGSGATLTIIQANFTQITLSTTLKNQGTVVQSASGGANNFVVASPGVIDNSGHWTVSSNFNPNISASGVVVFNNAGSFVQSTGTGTSTWTVPINGSGTINVASGTLVLKGASTGSITGSIAVQASAVLDYNQGGTLDGGQVTGSGTFIFTATTTVNGVYGFSGTTEISGGTVSFNGKTTIATFNVAGGAMAGTGPVTVTGKMNWTAGAVGGTGGLTIGSGATLTIIQANFTQITLSTTLKNQGTVVQSASGGANNFVVASPGVIDNSGHWTVSSNFNPNISASGVVVFNNAGSFVQSTGTGTSTWTVPIQNSGSFQANSGVLNISSFTQTGGNTSLGGGSLGFATTALFQGGSLTGSGNIVGSVSNTGANVEPGTGTTPAPINIGGSYSQSGTGSYSWNIGGATCNENGALNITGAATLGGALTLFDISGCKPVNKTAFNVMAFKSKTGLFATHTAGWNVSYTSTTLVATFEGGSGKPMVTLTPTELSFGTQMVGTTKSEPIKVTNSGTAPLTITKVAIGGTDASDFSQTNNCSEMDVDESCTVMVMFTPSASGKRSATLTLTDNAGTGMQAAPLTGVGTLVAMVSDLIALPRQRKALEGAGKMRRTKISDVLKGAMSNEAEKNPPQGNQSQKDPQHISKKNPSQDSDSQHKGQEKPEDQKRRAS